MCVPLVLYKAENFKTQIDSSLFCPSITLMMCFVFCCNIFIQNVLLLFLQVIESVLKPNISHSTH